MDGFIRHISRDRVDGTQVAAIFASNLELLPLLIGEHGEDQIIRRIAREIHIINDLTRNMYRDGPPLNRSCVIFNIFATSFFNDPGCVQYLASNNVLGSLLRYQATLDRCVDAQTQCHGPNFKADSKAFFNMSYSDSWRSVFSVIEYARYPSVYYHYLRRF